MRSDVERQRPMGSQRADAAEQPAVTGAQRDEARAGKEQPVGGGAQVRDGVGIAAERLGDGSFGQVEQQ
jgi:hypothetical protein